MCGARFSLYPFPGPFPKDYAPGGRDGHPCKACDEAQDSKRPIERLRPGCTPGVLDGKEGDPDRPPPPPATSMDKSAPDPAPTSPPPPQACSTPQPDPAPEPPHFRVLSWTAPPPFPLGDGVPLTALPARDPRRGGRGQDGVDRMETDSLYSHKDGLLTTTLL